MKFHTVVDKLAKPTGIDWSKFCLRVVSLLFLSVLKNVRITWCSDLCIIVCFAPKNSKYLPSAQTLIKEVMSSFLNS